MHDNHSYRHQACKKALGNRTGFTLLAHFVFPQTASSTFQKQTREALMPRAQAAKDRSAWRSSAVHRSFLHTWLAWNRMR